MNKNLLIFIVVALIILGIVYYFSSPPNEERGEESLNNDTSVGALEQELTNTDFDDLDQEFVDIETELEASISEVR